MLEDSFDACWRCGTSKEGVEDPSFQKVEEGEAAEAANEEASRAQTPTESMQVEEILFVQPRSSEAMTAAPTSGRARLFVQSFWRRIPWIGLGVLIGIVLLLLLQHLTRPTPYEQFKAISDARKARLTHFLETRQSRLWSYNTTVTDEPDVDKRVQSTHVGIIEFTYTVTKPEGESGDQVLNTASAEYRFSKQERKWICQSCVLKQGGTGFGDAEDSLVDFSDIGAFFIDALLAHGVKKEHLFCDKLSGTREDRPGLVACQRALQSGDTLVVWHLDRLGRSMRHLVNMIAELKERGIGFRSIVDGMIDTTSASGELVLNIFSALAHFERRLIQERTKAGLAECVGLLWNGV